MRVLGTSAPRRLRSGDKSPGVIDLCWIAPTSDQNYLNLGDALSPIMVAAISGRPVRHAPLACDRQRMSAVGTIGHSLEKGEVWVWGTGASEYVNPLDAVENRRRYVPGSNTSLRTCATRGPLSWSLLSGREPNSDAVFGDPVWLLPELYRPERKPRWELGVIIHLSENLGRTQRAERIDRHVRYRIPEPFGDSIKLINTICDVSLAGIKGKLDEILSCRRIVSTSLHGMVIAESYGIPCLYFPPFKGSGACSVDLADDRRVNSRFADLYRGLGMTRLDVYGQQRGRETNWSEVIEAIDRHWREKPFDGARLRAALPERYRATPLTAASDDFFDQPLIRNLPLR